MSKEQEDVDEFVSSIGELLRIAIKDNENDLIDYLEELADRADELEEEGDGGDNSE